MKCPKCGALAEAGDDICVCGASLTPVGEAPPPVPAVAVKSGGLFQPPSGASSAPTAPTLAKKASTGLFKPPGEGDVPKPKPRSGLFQPPAKGSGALACKSCGTDPAETDENGICTNCGEQVRFSQRDDFKVEVSPKLALRSLIGGSQRIHDRNEDFGIILKETVNGVDYSIHIVSDGVSSAERSWITSEAACKAGKEAVVMALRSGSTDMKAVLQAGIDAAQSAVLKLPVIGERDAQGNLKATPEATFLVAIVKNGVVDVAWLGDCRAYAAYKTSAGWSAVMLTKDHSWINLAVDAGQMSVAAAEADKRAHQIYQSLGEVTEQNPLEPSFRTFELKDYRYLVVCSDGFWNYAHPHQDQPAEALLDLLGAVPSGASALSVAESLVQYASQAGGVDNITVLVQSA